MTHRCHPMLFPYSAPPLLRTQIQSSNINGGDRTGVNTLEDGPIKIISKAPVRESCLTGVTMAGAIKPKSGS